MNDEAPSKNATYIATKADIARLEEQVKGNDRATAIRLAGIEALQDERSRALRDVFDAVRMAVDKAEKAQSHVNAVSNEWRGALNDSTKQNASRPELESIDKRVQALERGASGGGGKETGATIAQQNLRGTLTLIIAGLGGLCGLISLLVLLARLKS